ncbi:MAG TPA: tetratricopeptide repeat protein [Candidatus Aphodousia gallistercoris]|nr:tetratricopeptide repeat protein [Candidatus Aphodousia gallistercoris]
MRSYRPTLLALILGLAVSSYAAAAGYEYTEPKNEAERAELIRDMIGSSQYKLALEQVQKGLKANPKSAQLKFQQAVLYERLGQTERAKALFEDFINTYPEIVEPYNNLAAIYAAEGNTAKAREWLTRAVTVNPNFAMGYENLGNLELEQALSYYRQALKAKPSDKRMQRKVASLEKLLQ